MTPHLTLEELIDETREHGDCQRCRDEAAAWAKVREGIRLRDSAAGPPAGVLESVLAELDQPPAGRRILKPLSAAAAMVVLAAGGYGAASALGHAAKTTSIPATLTATGCTGLELAGGTLARTTGNDLAINVKGSQVTVTTTQTTVIYRVGVGALSDIADGQRVVVTGTENAGTITASSVGVLPDSVSVPTTPSSLGGLSVGLATGTVTQADSSGFTVTEKDGTRVSVITSRSVTVITTRRITVAQLATGELTAVVGTAGTGGTLVASTVEQNAIPAGTWSPGMPKQPSGLPPLGTPAKPSISLNELGCSAAAITTTYLLDGHL